MDNVFRMLVKPFIWPVRLGRFCSRRWALGRATAALNVSSSKRPSTRRSEEPGVERLHAMGAVDALAVLNLSVSSGVNSAQERRHISIIAR